MSQSFFMINQNIIHDSSFSADSDTPFQRHVCKIHRNNFISLSDIKQIPFLPFTLNGKNVCADQ